MTYQGGRSWSCLCRCLNPALIFVNAAAALCFLAPNPQAKPLPRHALPVTTFSEARRSDEKVVGLGSIRPGLGVGRLKLGDSRERFLEVFGHKREDEDYTYTFGEPCALEDLHWLDMGPPVRPGVFAYLREGRIFQIWAATPRFRTPEGITEDTFPQEVKRRYPHVLSYALLGSGAHYLGGRDLIYWVDRQKGIAFEFYYSRKKKQRLVYGTIIFQQGSDFLPEGCVQPPQEWRQLEPYSLEP